MDSKDLVQIKYGPWWEAGFKPEETKVRHAKNVKACLDAIESYNVKERPLRILVVHGSGRSSMTSAAQELSNSQLLLRFGLRPYRNNPAYEIEEISLVEFNIEPCNACYSTSSVLCGFPCNCFPWDPMQDLYPKVLACDVMLMSTPVNQSAMSTRLKTFIDRLISLDGGFFVDKDQYESKGPEWRDKCIALAQQLSQREGDLKYSPRMWGKVSAYFISSKDQNQTRTTVVKPFESKLSYIEAVAESLHDGQADYGFFHAEKNWYVGIATNPDVEMCYDKQSLNEQKDVHIEAEVVVRKAIELAEKLRLNPVPFDGGARINRT